MSDMVKVDLVKDAILHVDVQTAFMEDHAWDGALVKGGGLPVPDGHGILPAVLHNTSFFMPERRYASLDVHPRGHVSFASSYKGMKPYDTLTAEQAKAMPDHLFLSTECDGKDAAVKYLQNVRGGCQTLWPDHALKGREESHMHPALSKHWFKNILQKGMDPCCDSYSALSDNLGRETGLGRVLWTHGIRRVFVDGLAYTHCVGWTALDLASRGFETFVIKDATRSVPIPGAEERMDDDLVKAGVHIISSTQLAHG